MCAYQPRERQPPKCNYTNTRPKLNALRICLVYTLLKFGVFGLVNHCKNTHFLLIQKLSVCRMI